MILKNLFKNVSHDYTNTKLPNSYKDKNPKYKRNKKQLRKSYYGIDMRFMPFMIGTGSAVSTSGGDGGGDGGGGGGGGE